MTGDNCYLPLADPKPPAPSQLSKLRCLATPFAFACGIVLGIALSSPRAQSLAAGVATTSMLAEAPPASSTEATYLIAEPPPVVPEEYLASMPFNNSCLTAGLKIPDGPRTFDACKFVIESTDEVWNRRGSAATVEAAIDKYFHENYLDAGSWGQRIVGKAALKKAVFSEMRAFPDIQIHITDCVCNGNDNDGYKCAMPDVLTGTNLGPSAYGPATGNKARWAGLVQSWVKRNPASGQWQYYAEWGVHDEWSLIQQLGLDFSKIPHPPSSKEPLHDCIPLLDFTPAAAMDSADEVFLASNRDKWRV